jgi:hypothetical protein
MKKAKAIFNLVVLLVTAAIFTNCGESATKQSGDNKDTLSNNPEIIKVINEKLHLAFDNKTIIQKNDGASYIFILKTENNVEFYLELRHDSEGWPTEGESFYFHQNKLVGHCNMHCDGCVGTDISTKLKSFQIKKYETSQNSNEWDVIWSISHPNDELNAKANKILGEALAIKDKTAEYSINLSPKQHSEISNQFKNESTYYSLQDSRITDPSEVEVIGCWSEKTGYVFFIDNREINFRKDQTTISNDGSVVKVELKDSDIRLVLSWDSSVSEGVYNTGYVELYSGQTLIKEYSIFIDGI